MMRHLSILFVLLSANCHASDEFWLAGIEWAKSKLPKISQVDFNKSNIKFPGCKHRNYELMLTQPFGDALVVETSMGYSKGAMSLGGYEQKISVAQWSIIPRYQIREDLTIGAGIIYQSVADFSGVQGEQFELPKSRSWVLNTRLQVLAANHYLELSLNSKSWQPTNSNGNWFERGERDNSLTISYQGFF